MSIQIKLQGSVDHTNLKQPGVIQYELGQHGAPTYAKNLTTDVPADCYLVRNGTVVTGSLFSTPDETNYIEIHGLYYMKTLPEIDKKTFLDFSQLEYDTALTRIDLNVNPTKYVHITGNVEKLKKCINLVAMQLCLGAGSKPNVVGSLNALLDGMFSEGRTSGTLYVYSENTSIKYNGTTIANGFSERFDFSESGWSERQ